MTEEEFYNACIELRPGFNTSHGAAERAEETELRKKYKIVRRRPCVAENAHVKKTDVFNSPYI